VSSAVFLKAPQRRYLQTKKSSDAVKDHIFNAMSERAERSIQWNLKHFGREIRPISQIKKAQQKIGQLVEKMAKEGRLGASV